MEIALPLAVTVLLSAGFRYAVVLLFASASNGALLGRFVVAVAAQSDPSLVWRSLVRQAAPAG